MQVIFCKCKTEIALKLGFLRNRALDLTLSVRAQLSKNLCYFFYLPNRMRVRALFW